MGTVVGAWRLKTILFLVVTLSILYTINGLFYNIETDDQGFVVNDVDEIESGEGENFISLLLGLGDYLSFGNIDNVYARIIINLFVLCCWIIIGYLLYTFVREWFPLG